MVPVFLVHEEMWLSGHVLGLPVGALVEGSTANNDATWKRSEASCVTRPSFRWASLSLSKGRGGLLFLEDDHGPYLPLTIS
jgi:hypothetical protein